MEVLILLPKWLECPAPVIFIACIYMCIVHTWFLPNRETLDTSWFWIFYFFYFLQYVLVHKLARPNEARTNRLKDPLAVKAGFLP